VDAKNAGKAEEILRRHAEEVRTVD